MPSSVLQNKIPYNILYPNNELFALPSKIFGSLCFVHNHSPHKTKLDPRSFQGIFLGYSRTQKCYKCFCPSLNRYMFSADVTFFESKYGISTTSSIVSTEEYDYLLVQETFIPSGVSATDNTTGKDPLRFQEPMQVYTRCNAPAPVPPSTSLTNPEQVQPTSSDDDLPIALRKGKRTCTRHLISQSVSYSHLSPSFSSFISSLNSYSVPKNVSEALSMSEWTQTM